MPRTDFRSRNPRFAPENLTGNADRFAPLRELAAAKGCATGQLALAWLLAKGAVPIPGTRNPRHLAESLGAAEIVLAPAEVAALDERFPAGTAAGGTFR